MLLGGKESRQSNVALPCTDDEIRDDRTQGRRILRLAMGKSKRKRKKKEKPGVWEMTPDTPHWRSGALVRQIGLFFFGLFAGVHPANRSALQGNRTLSPSLCVANFLPDYARRVETDGIQIIILPSPRSIEHPIASRPDDLSRPFTTCPARSIRRGRNLVRSCLSVLELGPLDCHRVRHSAAQPTVLAHCLDAAGARKDCKLLYSVVVEMEKPMCEGKGEIQMPKRRALPRFQLFCPHHPQTH